MKPFQSNLFTILYGNITVHCVTVIPTKQHFKKEQPLQSQLFTVFPMSRIY